MNKFPANFLWGTATSAYQIEGAWLDGGRGLTIWDAFSHTPGRTHNGATGDVACDHFHRFREDVQLMRNMGVKAYRFSVAWSRIQPSGSGAENPEGIRFYSELIDELLTNDIEPWITLYHWDLPLALELESDGWLSPSIAECFGEYAQICFESFGDRVKNWITLNEPWVVSLLGYGNGMFAPGRTSMTEPYIVAHNQLRAHAEAVRVYRDEFVGKQNGLIGITNNCDWREPKSEEEKDVQAAQRALEFALGWFADPIYRGDYPDSMRERLGDRLPKFSLEEQELLQGSSDFFGLNHYSTALAAEPAGDFTAKSCFDDPQVELSNDPSWEKTDMDWPVVPEGISKLLHWIRDRYNNPPIYITENGCAAPGTDRDSAIEDEYRVRYLSGYLGECLKVINDGVDLRGYFVWSLLDNFEWAEGYSKRFGIHYVDYSTQERTPKISARWYKQLVEGGSIEF